MKRRNDLGSAGGFGKFLIVGQRNSIDHEDSDPGWILHARPLGIGRLRPREGRSVFENIFLLHFRPLAGERREAVEIFLVDHSLESLTQADRVQSARRGRGMRRPVPRNLLHDGRRRSVGFAQFLTPIPGVFRRRLRL